MVSAHVVHVTSVRIPQVVGAHLRVVGAHLRGVGAHQCMVVSMYEKWLDIGFISLSNLWRATPVLSCLIDSKLMVLTSLFCTTCS